jgi:hypothetical protein
MSELSDDEIQFELQNSVDPYVGCFDIHACKTCCLDCHDAHDAERPNLTVMEMLGRIPVETFLCCTHREYWHGLSMSEKIELLNEAESDPNRPECLMVNEELVRDVLLAIEDAIEKHDDPSQAVSNLHVRHYGPQEVSDQIQILDGIMLEAEKVPDKEGEYWYAKRITQKGWQFLDAVRDANVWMLAKDELARRTLREGKRRTSQRVALLFELGRAYAAEVKKTGTVPT